MVDDKRLNNNIIKLLVILLLLSLTLLVVFAVKIFKDRVTYLEEQLVKQEQKNDSLIIAYSINIQKFKEQDSVLTFNLKASKNKIQIINNYYDQKIKYIANSNDSITIKEFNKLLRTAYIKYGHMLNNN